MKINFTKKEYQTLVEMLLVADWVIHGYDVEPREATKSYNDLRRKVLSYHKEMGMEDDFRYKPEEDDYFETANYKERAPRMRRRYIPLGRTMKKSRARYEQECWASR